MTREQSKSPKGKKPNPGPKASKKNKPMAKQANKLAKQGRMGDSMLVHMNPQEVNGIASLSPMGLTKNPQTGLPEAFLPFLFAPALAAAAPAAAAIPAAAGVAAAAAPAAMGAGALGAGALGAAAPAAMGAGALGAAAPAAAAGTAASAAPAAAAAPLAAEAAGAGLSSGIGSGLTSGAATGGSSLAGTAPLAAEAAGSSVPSLGAMESGIGALPGAEAATTAPASSMPGATAPATNPITNPLSKPPVPGAGPTQPGWADKALGLQNEMIPSAAKPTPEVLPPKAVDQVPMSSFPKNISAGNTIQSPFGANNPGGGVMTNSSPPSVNSPMSGTASPPSVNSVTTTNITGAENGLPLDDPFNTAVKPPTPFNGPMPTPKPPVPGNNPLLPPVPEPGANMIAKPAIMPESTGIGTLPPDPAPTGLSAAAPPKPPTPPLAEPMTGPTGLPHASSGPPPLPNSAGGAPTRMGPIAPTRLGAPGPMTMPAETMNPAFSPEGPMSPFTPDPVASTGIGPLSPSPNVPPAGPTPPAGPVAPTPPGSIPPTGPGSTPTPPAASGTSAASSTTTNNGLFGTGISSSTLMQGMIPAMMMSQMMQQPMRPMKEEGGGRKGSGSYAEGSWEPDFNNDKNSTAEHNYFPNKEYKITPKTGSAKKKAMGGRIDDKMGSGIGGFNSQPQGQPQMGGSPPMGMSQQPNFNITPYSRSQEPMQPQSAQAFKGFMNGMQDANNPFKYMIKHMGPPTHAGIQRRNMGGGIGNFNEPAAFNGGGMVNSPEKELIYKAQAILEGKAPDNGELGMYIQTYGPDSLRDLAKRMAGGGQVNSNRQSTQEPHYLNGPGDGMTDSIPAQAGQQDVILSDGEYIIPADVVSGLGNGSSNAGARRLDQMVQELRQYRTGTPKQPKQIDPKQVMP